MNTKRKINKVYLSGAIEHMNREERMKKFADAEELLKAFGREVVNPFKNGLPPETDWHEHMRRDINLLLGCDAIFMLQGWELSKGCKLELDVATSCGLRMIIETTFFSNLENYKLKH